MLRWTLLLEGLLFMAATSLACRAGICQSPGIGHQRSAILATRASLKLELDRAITVLKRGILENWATRDQYLVAFEKTPGTDLAGRPVTEEKKHVECVIGSHLRFHRLWDESFPIQVEVHQTILELRKQRDSQATDIQLSPCTFVPLEKVALSAGVAASMLKTKIDPVYPNLAPKDRVFGTVVIHAAIGVRGETETLRIISGPVALQQAALDAVRHWTYRPYVLNGKPVPVETTINVVFAPGRSM